MPSPCAARLRAATAVLRGVADVLETRVVSPAAPWADARGWTEFLSGLDDEALERAEVHGLGTVLAGAPSSLRALGEAIDGVLAPFSTPAVAATPVETRCVPLRKRAQVAALVTMCRPLLPGLRGVVDFGSGKGHLTRALAAELGLPARGIDREQRAVDTARQLAGAAGATFEVGDERTPLSLGPRDLLVGLHACGLLGDAVVRRAAACGAHVLLVSCCLQKIRATSRAPLSRAGSDLRLDQGLLGLTNVAARSAPAGAIRGRAVRHALRLLLVSRGVSEPPGSEARWLNRRRFRHGLSAVAPTALGGRGLAPATSAELAWFEAEGWREHELMRRLSLPRNALGRVVEVAVALDRAALLEEAGHDAAVEVAFAGHASPRNLTVVTGRCALPGAASVRPCRNP